MIPEKIIVVVPPVGKRVIISNLKGVNVVGESESARFLVPLVASEKSPDLAPRASIELSNVKAVVRR